MSDDAHFKWRWAKLPWYQHRRRGKLCKIKCSNWAPHRISTLTRAPGDGGENRSLGQFGVVLGVKLIVVQPLLLSFADLSSSPFSFCWFAGQPLPPFNWFNPLSFSDCWNGEVDMVRWAGRWGAGEGGRWADLEGRKTMEGGDTGKEEIVSNWDSQYKTR